MKNKMKPCKICSQPIAKNAKSCPFCGARNRRRHPLLLVIIIIAAIVVLVNALNQNNKSQLTRSTQMPKGTTFTAAEETSAPQESSTGIRPAFKEAMDSYEAFYIEYCAFLEDYSSNPTDFTLLADYASLTAQAAEMDEAFNAWDEDAMTEEELKYYLDVNNRIMQMLVDVSY